MASPLSPAQGSALNAARQRRYDEYEVYKYTTMTNTHHGGGSSSSSSKLQYQQNTGDYNNNNNNNDDGHDDEDPPSSPLISHTSTMPVPEEQENNTQGQQQQQQQQQYYHQQSQRSNALQSRRRHSRVISGTELSPLKILSRKRASVGDDGDEYDNKLQEQHNEDENRGRMGPPPARNPRRLSPVRRFPVKVSGGEETHRATAAAAGMMQQERRDNGYSMGDALRKNQGLKQAIEVFEDGDSSMEEEQEEDCGGGQVNKEAPAAATTENADASAEEAAPGADDTMASTFSTFSAVPNMAMLAKLGHSPFKGQQPRAGSPLKTSRPSTRDESGGNTTNLLMDFTDQLRYPHKSSPEKRGNLPGSVTTPNLGDAGQNATPSRRLTNLIDFDIPPQPTPRSVPSITPRELESLKSGFLSQISSLKASLSGKEAEVQSLKTAVGDAEKRAGETMEQLREESALKEQVSAEKEDWEKRGLEMEKMLRQVKEDVELSQTEREDLERKLEESEKRREAAEIMHQEAESKIAGLRAGRDGGSSSSGSGVEKPASSPGQTNKEVEIAVERVARELHTLYKSKHETKVTALKKSYEARWEKKVTELEKRVAELSEQNVTLQRAADKQASRTTETGNAAAGMEARKQQAAKDSARIQELNADIQRLEAVVTSVQKDNSDMREMLEKERVEKGELVQLAEEMMSMQSFVGGSAATQRAAAAAAARSESEMTKTPKTSAESRRASMGRASGIRAPGSALRGQSRTSVGGAAGGVSRFGVPTPRRSGIMSSIEKMGSHRGRGQQE